MIKTLSLAAGLALATFALPVSAAPIGSLKGADVEKTTSGAAQPIRYRRCWWHHGHRHCRWHGTRGYYGYGPSFGYYFGGHRHRHWGHSHRYGHWHHRRGHRSRL